MNLRDLAELEALAEKMVRKLDAQDDGLIARVIAVMRGDEDRNPFAGAA